MEIKIMATVEYELEVFDTLPAAPPKNSKLSELMEKIKEMPTGKPILIRRFDSAGKATGTANHLKLRWGTKPDAYGFSFKTRRIDDTNHGLFVIYEPEKIVDGAAAEVDKKYEEHRDKAAAKQRDRTAAKLVESGDVTPKRRGRPPTVEA